MKILLSILIIFSGCTTSKIRTYKPLRNVHNLKPKLNGQLCLGRNYSKTFQWSHREPAIVTKDLLLNTSHSVSIIINDQVVQKLNFSIDPSYSNTVTIYRSAGYFRVIQNTTDSCKGSTRGYEISRQTGKIKNKKELCFDYKISSSKNCK